jgi:U3 small nucleolar RNA-associated protein 14
LGHYYDAFTEKASKRKEVMLSESYPESEFNLNPGGKGSVTTVQGISVEELMGSLHETAGFGALRKRMQQLEKRGAPVHPPLPKAMQEKVERKVGYEKTRDEITKWQPQVKMNREARTLFFNQKEEVVPSSTAALAAKFTPTTDMEKEIASVLSESKLGDVKAVEAAEALELNKVSLFCVI